MTIIFNPRYDSSVFLTAEDCGLGKTFSGKQALLSELELRAGLTCAGTELNEPREVEEYGFQVTL